MPEDNIFDDMASESGDQQEKMPHMEENNSSTPETPVSDEIDLGGLSNIGAGQQQKYERENLDGKEFKILSAKMFNPDRENDKIISGMTNDKTKYYKTKFILTLDGKNKDDVNHREYISGAIQFIQKDNTLSQPLLWYEGSRSQSGQLFAKVAEKKGVDPKDLSPREFMNFLNSGPKVVMKDVEIEYDGKMHHKNLVEKFI